MKTTTVQVRFDNGDVISDGYFDISDQCLGCQWLRESQLACRAFPAGIPDDIRLARFDHRRLYPGDNGIHFDPVIAAGKGK